MIGIIDYDAGNIRSVEKALVFLNQEVAVTSDPETLLACDKVILPGVGNFGDAAGNLRRFGLEPVIHRIIEKGTPFLGICVGLQLLFDESEESPGVPGLGILKGKIRRIPAENGLKIPHMGWNSLLPSPTGRLFAGLGDEPFVYFVHSYYLEAADRGIVSARTKYGVEIDAAAEQGNIFACQFHPEKSGAVGLRILQNFAGLCDS